MRLGTVVVLGLALASCDAARSFRDEARAKEAVEKLLIDPTSAEFQDLSVQDRHVCGEVNGKNANGAFVGFKRFVVSAVDWSAEIDPEFDYSDLISATELCSSMRSNSYSSIASTSSACERAAEMEASRAAQERFNTDWSAHCQVSARLPFQPELQNISGPATPTNAVVVIPSSASSDASEPAPSTPALDGDDDNNVMKVDENLTVTDADEN